MHIPDGFIAPQMYLPAYALAGVAWAHGLRCLRRQLDERRLPLLAVLTALCFTLSLIVIPLPGGSSAHANGVALLALLFGLWPAFIAFSVVLLMQALLFGDGGITALPINALSMGLVTAALTLGLHKLFSRLPKKLGLPLAVWLANMSAALCVAVVLGVQPWIAHQADGTPLFFPFDLSVTLPAILLPYFFLNIGEALFTLMLYRYAQRYLMRTAAHES